MITEVKNTTQPEIKNQYVIDDNFSSHILSDKDDPYPSEEHELIDKKIHKYTYDILNKYVYENMDSYIHLVKVDRSNFEKILIAQPKLIKEILSKLENDYPSLYSIFDPSIIELDILHHISRYLYDFSEYLQKYSGVTLYLRKYRRSFILNNIYRGAFKVLKSARSFLYQQISHLLSYNIRNFERIFSLLYTYTELDEDKIIVNCIDSFCGNIIYKVCPLKAKNAAAVVKSLYRRILRYMFSVTLTDDDDETDVLDSSYRIIYDISELERLNIQSKYSFLLSMLNTAYELSTNYTINNLPMNKKYYIDYVKQNYIKYSRTNINIFRFLYFYIHNNIDENKHIFKYMYNDLIELMRIVSEDRYKEDIKSKYPELYRFIKSIAVVNEEQKRSMFNLRRDMLESYLKSKLSFKLGLHLNDEFLNEIASALSKYTYNYMKNTIFIHSITEEPIVPFDVTQFCKELTDLYIEFLVGN